MIDIYDQNSDYKMDIFNALFEIGYDKMLIYDNYGILICPIWRSNFALFSYFDICIFHEEDDDLYEMILNHEMNRMNDDCSL